MEIHEQGQRHVNQAKDSNHPSNQFTKTDNNSFKIWSHGKNDTSDGVHSMNNKPKNCKIGQWKTCYVQYRAYPLHTFCGMLMSQNNKKCTENYNTINIIRDIILNTSYRK